MCVPLAKRTALSAHCGTDKADKWVQPAEAHSASSTWLRRQGTNISLQFAEARRALHTWWLRRGRHVRVPVQLAEARSALRT